MELSYSDFVELYGPLLSAYKIPSHLFKSLHQKLTSEEFDAGNYFSLTPDDEKIGKYHVVVTCEEGILESGEDSVFLIDHAWTYAANEARKTLEDNGGLLRRMAKLVGLSEESQIDDVLPLLWKFNQTYSVPSGDAATNGVSTPVWYVLDEFGSSIHHSDNPNIATIPFFYQPLGVTFNVMWLLKDVEYGERIVRDFAHGETDPIMRSCKLLPWREADLTHIVPATEVVAEHTYQARADFVKETLPNPVVEIESSMMKKKGQKLKVYFDGHQQGTLDTKLFTVTDNYDEADIVWSNKPFKDFKKMSEVHPTKMLNQFPCEQILCNKDFFAALSIRNRPNREAPAWLPLTYNLQSELAQFVSQYQRRARAGDDNVWICKPWNLARGLGIHVTDNLDQVVRLRETDIPKVVCKYASRQVLFHRADISCDVKFSFRIYVCLKSVSPLRLFVSNHTRLYVANKPYELKKFDEYDRHFTAMFYFDDGKQLREIVLDEFVPAFERQYPAHKWSEVLNKAHESVAEFFASATDRGPPFGLGHYQNSRAFYAIDALLQWNDQDEMQPTLLECNFVPDCSQTVKTDPQFINNIFKLLFTDANCEECDMKEITP